MTNFKNKLYARRGFTLIELLIVIAILGVLAVVVLIALNPVQQLARTRDAGRISTVTQLGHAIEAFATTRSGVYPAEAGATCAPANWVGCLVQAGEISTAPAAITYSVAGIAACGVNAVNGTCYDAAAAAGTAPAIVFARLEAAANNSRCAAGTPEAYAVYSTADGRGGIVCRAAGAPPVFGVQVYLP